MERAIEQVRFYKRPPAKMKRVAAYARVSSGKDAMLHSLSAQVSYYSDLIQKRRRWLYCEIYANKAITGTKDDRANFQRLLDDCRAGQIDLIITKSISRFARNTVSFLQIVRELKDMGVDVYFEEQNIHTMSADGELMLTILVSYAQEESLSVSENCKWYWRQRMKEGHMVGLRRMFGYSIERGAITVNPTEAAIVRSIFEQYVSGGSTVGIARALEASGVPTVSGGKWNDSRVRDILKNEKYMGNALLQKKYVADHLTKRLVRNHGELAQYYVEGTHEAIIDADTFERAQRRMAENAKRCNVQQPTTARYPFSGMIVCGNCGKHFGRKTTHGRISWQCMTFQFDGKDACPAKQIPEPTLLSVCCEVLGIAEFDERVFGERVSGIRVTAPNELLFTLADGRSVTKVWKDRSRKESWTEEMKEAARQRSKKKWRELQHD